MCMCILNVYIEMYISKYTYQNVDIEMYIKICIGLWVDLCGNEIKI